MRPHDAFGTFTVANANRHRNLLCNACGEKTNHTIRYFTPEFKLPRDIEVGKTILKATDNSLGIECGCYGKFHRQIAHIRDKMSFTSLD